MSNNTTSFNRTASRPSFTTRERQSGPLQFRISRTDDAAELPVATTELGALTSDCIYSGAAMASCTASRRVMFILDLVLATKSQKKHKRRNLWLFVCFVPFCGYSFHQSQ